MTYKCCDCNYETERKNNWIKHINTSKHIKKCLKNKDLAVKSPKSTVKKNNYEYICEFCNKKYKFLSGLSRHKKYCNVQEDTCENEEINFNNNQNKILKDQQKQILSLQKLLEKSIENNNNTLNNIIPKIGNTTNNINNQMTINLFLNEECKNAMNLTDFMNQLQLSLDDLLYTKNNGYIKGITNIFVKNLCDMPANSRPIHCSDKKKLQFYVKDEDKWGKDNKNEKIDKSIHDITQKQIQKIKQWEQEHPNWNQSENETAMYIELVKQVMGGLNNQDKQNNLEIIKKEISDNIDIQNVMDNKNKILDN